MYLHPPAPNDVSRFLSDMLDITGNILQDHRGINVWPRPHEHTSFLDELDKRRPFVITTRPAAGEGVLKHDSIYVDSTHYSTRRLTIISRFSELYFCYILYTKKILSRSTVISPWVNALHLAKIAYAPKITSSYHVTQKHITWHQCGKQCRMTLYF